MRYNSKEEWGIIMTRIIFIRHGESLANAKHIYLGHTDWDLSELGYEQAQRAAELLCKVKIDKIYSSDLIRAYNTALPHAKRRGIDVIKCERLREVYLGDWECREVARLGEEYPEEFLIGWHKNFGTCKVPGGESIPELAERIYCATVDIARDNEGKTLLFGCHAAAIRAFWGKVTGTKPEDVCENIPFPKNASFTVVDFDGEKLIPVIYGAEDPSQFLQA